MTSPLRHPTAWWTPARRAWLRCSTAVLMALAGATALATPDVESLSALLKPRGAALDRLTLLVPDDADRTSWHVRVWLDTAAEEGIRLDVLTDSDLLALGSQAASRIAGLVVPDSAHLKASAAVVAAIQQYAYLGGRLMLVYDAGVLTDQGVFPTTGPSRFSALVGVDYALWNNGQGAATMVGFGPVVGTRARLDTLRFPPGKYQPYVPPPGLASALVTNTATPAAVATAAFVPASVVDPGASTVMQPLVARRGEQGIDEGSDNVRRQRTVLMRQLLGIGVEADGPMRYQRRHALATAARDGHLADAPARSDDADDASDQASTASASTSTSTSTPDSNRANSSTNAKATTTKATAASSSVTPLSASQDNTLQTITGYGFGPLNYFHYVTTGRFPGTVYLSSPDHGLVAGRRDYGSGQVLFVNMPLGYFKALGTDGAPLHGFLGHFARNTVGIVTQAVQPRARGGLIYNWHVDDGDDLTVNSRFLLDQTDVFKRGPFSIHFTAGPDVIKPGDGRGMNLDGNADARDLVRRLGSLGPYAKVRGKDRLPAHVLGSHGGWIHDFWGANANEANTPDLTHLLAQNFAAIERTTGQKIREYSSPVGNTPTWAINWMEKRGVVAMYLVADLGNGMTRPWRGGQRLTDKLWSSPVTPLGRFATFEEFDRNAIGNDVSGEWLLDLQTFVVSHRTNRMFYNHPPGAAGHLPPVNALLERADALEKEGRFSWYTMSALADFNQRRIETTWLTQRGPLGLTTIRASHPDSLADVSWMLPKSRFSKPSVRSGKAVVTSGSSHWIVTVDEGRSVSFITLQY